MFNEFKTPKQKRSPQQGGALKTKTNSVEGVIALSLAIVIMLIGTAIVVSLVFVFLNRLSSTQNTNYRAQSYQSAEAGVEDYLLRFADDGKSLPASDPYTISFGRIDTTVDPNDLPDGDKEVISEGTRLSRKRTARAVINKNTTGASFFYGAQVGDGGLTMQNGSQVTGSVYVNADISGNNDPVVTEDAFAAVTSTIDGMVVEGNAEAFTISDTTVDVDAHADSLSDCTVNGDAFFDSSISGCTVSGSTTEEAYEQLDKEDMPISDSTVEDWKDDAESGEVVPSGDSRCTIGDDSNTETVNIGPAKFDCDLTLQNKGKLVVEGYIWVDGDITLQNQSVIELDSSFGGNSSAVIADDSTDTTGSGTVSVGNNSEVRGSGTEGSFLSMVSMNNSAEEGGDTQAISVANGTASSIFYAPHGLVSIQNNVNLTEVTAYQLEIQNSAVVEYDQGLENATFSGGPSGGFSIRTWEEI